MINIKDGLNRVILTLNEDLTNSGYGYIFQLINIGEEVYFTAENISIYTERYDEFIVEVNSGETNLTGGTIQLEMPGLWDYKVYEKLNPITIADLNKTTTDTLQLIELGKMIYNGRVKDETTHKVDINKKVYYK